MPRNNADFHGVTFSHQEGSLNTVVVAKHPTAGVIGTLGLVGSENPRVSWLDVHPDWRRKGVATGMWKYAQEQGLNPSHSTTRTPDGDSWAKSLGEPLPENMLQPENSNPNFSQWK